MSASASMVAAAAGPMPFAAPVTAGAATTSNLAGAGEVTIALVLVLLVIFACAWCVKRLRGLGRPQGRVLAIVDDMSVGEKERVLLLACGAERLLVGVAPGGVRLLHVVPPTAFASMGDDFATAPVVPVPTPPGSHEFRSILRRSLGLSR